MFGKNNEENNKVIIEIRALINEDGDPDFEEDLDDYCAFMKQMFLDTSGLN